MSSNAYSRLLNLLPKAPLEIGTVLYSADGVATVQLPGGGIVKARGVAADDAVVYVKSGAIEGPAPNLTPGVIYI